MYRRFIHIIGDSIGKGWALSHYEEELSPSNPLYLFRSISSMANNVLYENGIRDEFHYTGIPAVNLSSDISATVADIRALIANGTIRSGDVVLAEDAGPNSQDPDAYQAQWEQVRAAVTDRFDITLVMMSMFSYSTTDLTSRYDLPVGVSPQRTMNDATAAAYQAAIQNERGQTLWVDMKTAMDNWRYSAKVVDNVDVIHPDLIHPNVWGQAKMVGELLRALQYRPYINTADALKNLASAQYASLKYGSTTFNATRASQYMHQCILG